MSNGRSIPSAPAADDYVLLPPQRRSREALGSADAPASAGPGADTAGALAVRVECEGEILGLLLGEVRERLERLDGATAEASRAQLKGAVRELSAVVAWCDAVQRELLAEARRGLTGRGAAQPARAAAEPAGR